MPQDTQVQQPVSDAGGAAAATQPAPEYHPLFGGGQEPEPRASAPEPAPSPEPAQPQPQGEPQPGQPVEAEPSDDWKAKYEELTQKLEAEHAQREQERQTFEQQQQQYLEYQRQENERRAAELRKQAEEQYSAGLDEVYERVASADDDATGKRIMDQFIRERIAAPIAQTFRQQLTEERQQHEQLMNEARAEVEQVLRKALLPGFAAQVAQQHGLPEKAAEFLMTASEPDQMPAMAEQFKSLLAQIGPEATQQVMEQRVEQHRQEGTYVMGAPGGAPGHAPKPEPMSSDDPRAVAATRSLLGLA